MITWQYHSEIWSDICVIYGKHFQLVFSSIVKTGKLVPGLFTSLVKLKYNVTC